MGGGLEKGMGWDGCVGLGWGGLVEGDWMGWGRKYGMSCMGRGDVRYVCGKGMGWDTRDGEKGRDGGGKGTGCGGVRRGD
jgi:hypothetical protein